MVVEVLGVAVVVVGVVVVLVVVVVVACWWPDKHYTKKGVISANSNFATK